MYVDKKELKEILENLESHKGRHTELISVYIPAGYDVNAVQRQLESEKSTAKNIKSAATRKNVVEALEKIVRELKDLKRTPKNGLALFCGDISQIEGQQDLQLWAIEPPTPLNSRLYRCDKDFVLEPLKEMLEATEVFGLLVMDRKEASIGLLEGKRIEILQNISSGVPSKVRAGGQSSQRFHRITEGLTKEFYKRVAQEMKSLFFEMPKLKGILVGGPIPTKDEFLDGEYLTAQLRNKVIGRIDMGDTSKSGLWELVERAGDILAQQEITKEKEAVKEYFKILSEKKTLAALGLKDVKHALEYGAAEKILVSTKIDKKIIKDLEDLTENTGASLEIISIETIEGEQFFNMGGIGAILRFRV